MPNTPDKLLRNKSEGYKLPDIAHLFLHSLLARQSLPKADNSQIFNGKRTDRSGPQQKGKGTRKQTASGQQKN